MLKWKGSTVEVNSVCRIAATSGKWSDNVIASIL